MHPLAQIVAEKRIHGKWVHQDFMNRTAVASQQAAPLTNICPWK